jgi:exonuclease-1
MGIQGTYTRMIIETDLTFIGLLPLLKSIQRPCNLKQFAGQTIGIDAYGWLHRGTVACAVELATDKPTTKYVCSVSWLSSTDSTRYVDFAMSRVRMLKHFGITPYLVFDGDYLPSKSKTEKERSARRKESKKLGLELLNRGKTSQAYLELQKSVDVTPEMAGLLIEELKRANVQYVVAPYEADSQMVYLEKKGVINGILSEDSDLLVFGAKKLLTKLDQYGGCFMIRRDDFTACREVSLVGWSDKEFRHMAILSGCDYLNSIDKMGLKTAHRLLRKHKSMERVIRAVQFDGKFKVPTGYMEAFTQAELTFLHQWVYCPEAKGLVHLTSLEKGTTADDLPFIGAFVESKLASGVACGELHPHTKEPLQLPIVPTRRWMGPPKKRAVVETPELKKHRSIDSFFKPGRTPLAELDINLFSGSPTQQEMARRASASSWPATPVESNTPGTVMARPPAIPASAPVVARRAFSETTSLLLTASERAPKRQRLCAEGSSPVAEKIANRIDSGRSKFFGGVSSATPSKQSKRAKAATDFTLWSDDSVEEALSQLPLPDGFDTQTKPRKNKLDVFEDTTPTQPVVPESFPAPVVEKDTQVTSVLAVFSQDQTPPGTPPSSPDSEDEGEGDRSTTPFDMSLKAEIAGLRSRFSFEPINAAKPPLSSKLAKRKSPLQPEVRTLRLGLDGYAESHPSAEDLPEVGGQSNQEPEKEECIMVPGSDTIQPLSPAKQDIDTGQTSSGMVGGSEDLLVSESEVEASEAGTPRISRFLDLGRFAFGAA